MAVIWGLDLREIQWSKFKSSNMWNTDYHLRRTKFIVYQIAMISCVVSESLGTAALSDYISQQDAIIKRYQSVEYNDDFVGIGSYNIFTGIYVATIFGAAFFFDLFWPERYESPAVKMSWKICAILAPIFVLGDAIALTVIVASHSAYITGPEPLASQAEAWARSNSGSPLKYGDNGRAIASTVFIWPGLIATIASCFILLSSYRHNEVFGPLSAHKRAERKAYTESDTAPSSFELSDSQARQAASYAYPQPPAATARPDQAYQNA